jgi:rfaE bifunctional protein nucleotidyltransferase chain/domain
VLVVGLNSDASVRRLKGAGRPLLPQDERAELLAALRSVDHVVIFDDLTPSQLLALLRPDVHCKAGDYTIEGLPEAEVVRRHGGEVRILALAPGYSTSRLIERIHVATQGAEPPDQAGAGGDWRADVAEQLLGEANLLRQTAYRVSDLIVESAARIAGALVAGKRVLVYGDKSSVGAAHEFVVELSRRYRRLRDARLDRGDRGDALVFVGHVDRRVRGAAGGPWRPGDVGLMVRAGEVSPDSAALVEQAQARGAAVVELTGAWSAPYTADLTLAVPAEEPARVAQTHSIVLRMICHVVERMLIEGSVHG